MTERFLPDGEKPKRKQIKALREHVAAEIESAAWLDEGGRLVGVGGTVRNLAAAAQLAAGLPSYGIQGYRVTRDALGELIETLRVDDRGRARRRARDQGRARRPDPRRRAGDRHRDGGGRLRDARGHRRRPARGRVLRVAARRPAAGRATSAARPCATSPPSTTPTSRTPSTSPGSRWRCGTALAAAGVHRGDPKERELLWATAMLHDIGIAVDYDDHHKHSRYLILSAGLPGFTPREVGADRPGRALSPQGQPRASASSPRSPATATRRCSTGSRPRCASPSSSSARATSPSTPATSHVADGDGRAAPARRRGRHDRPLGGRASGRRVPQGVRPRAKRHLNGLSTLTARLGEIGSRPRG